MLDAMDGRRVEWVVLWLEIALIGLGIGFLGGLFGKGRLRGGHTAAVPGRVPAIAAVASPLPATIPGTLVAAGAYRRAGMIELRTVGWSLATGLPATVLGALATNWIDGLGAGHRHRDHPDQDRAPTGHLAPRARCRPDR